MKTTILTIAAILMALVMICGPWMISDEWLWGLFKFMIPTLMRLGAVGAGVWLIALAAVLNVPDRII